MTTSSETPPEVRLWELCDLCSPWCLHVAATLRVADHIAAGVDRLDALATVCGADPAALGRVLRRLVSRGVFEEPVPGRFGLNDAARLLIGESPPRDSLDLDGFGGRMAMAWGSLLSAVRTGRPAYDEVFGLSLWDDLDAHPSVAASFDAMMGSSGAGDGPDPDVLVDPVGWDGVRAVVDVGGGTGSLLAAILRRRPDVTGTLVDLPRPVRGSAEVFAAAGVSDRARAVGQSFFEPLPAGADLYVLRNVLNDWPDAEAVAILRRCAGAVRPDGGRVVVFGGMAADEAGRSGDDLLMMVLLGGRERTLAEVAALAGEAGLVVAATGKQPTGALLVECRPAGT